MSAGVFIWRYELTNSGSLAIFDRDPPRLGRPLGRAFNCHRTLL